MFLVRIGFYGKRRKEIRLHATIMTQLRSLKVLIIFPYGLHFKFQCVQEEKRNHIYTSTFKFYLI